MQTHLEAHCNVWTHVSKLTTGWAINYIAAMQSNNISDAGSLPSQPLHTMGQKCTAPIARTEAQHALAGQPMLPSCPMRILNLIAKHRPESEAENRRRIGDAPLFVCPESGRQSRSTMRPSKVA